MEIKIKWIAILLFAIVFLTFWFCAHFEMWSTEDLEPESEEELSFIIDQEEVKFDSLQKDILYDLDDKPYKMFSTTTENFDSDDWFNTRSPFNSETTTEDWWEGFANFFASSTTTESYPVEDSDYWKQGWQYEASMHEQSAAEQARLLFGNHGFDNDFTTTTADYASTTDVPATTTETSITSTTEEDIPETGMSSSVVDVLEDSVLQMSSEAVNGIEKSGEGMSTDIDDVIEEYVPETSTAAVDFIPETSTAFDDFMARGSSTELPSDYPASLIGKGNNTQQISGPEYALPSSNQAPSSAIDILKKSLLSSRVQSLPASSTSQVSSSASIMDQVSSMNIAQQDQYRPYIPSELESVDQVLPEFSNQVSLESENQVSSEPIDPVSSASVEQVLSSLREQEQGSISSINDDYATPIVAAANFNPATEVNSILFSSRKIETFNSTTDLDENDLEQNSILAQAQAALSVNTNADPAAVGFEAIMSQGLETSEAGDLSPGPSFTSTADSASSSTTNQLLSSMKMYADQLQQRCNILSNAHIPNHRQTRTNATDDVYMMVSDKYQFMGCKAAKVGSTNIQRLVYAIENNIHDAASLPQSLARKQSEPMRLSSKDNQPQRFNTYLKFMVYRDPLERLVSAYRDSKPNAYFADKQPSFADYLMQALEDDNIENTHRPWREITTLCNPCEIQYDYILPLSMYTEGISTILSSLNVPSLIFPTREETDYSVKSSQEVAEEFYAKIPMEVQEKLRKKYAKDYFLFYGQNYFQDRDY